MRILFIAVDLSTYDKTPWGLTADVYHFRKAGHEVKVITKKNAWKFYFEYLKFRPDIVVSSGILGFVPAFFKKVKLVRKPHVHMWEDYYAEQMGKKYPMEWMAFLEMITIRHSDFITSVSKYNVVKAKILGKKAKYIPHGVQEKMGKTDIKLRGNVKIIYIGEQSIYKQTDKMIEAVRGLDCDLYLIGDKGSRSPFKKDAPENVHFIDAIPADEIPEVLKQADILINPSDQDSSFKFFEYIRIGKPILAFRGRPAYILSHRENAFLTEDFGEGLKKLISDKSLRSIIEKNMPKLQKELVLSWPEVAKKHLDIYETILNS